MLGIITYGSLINPQETVGLEAPPSHTIPLKLSAFKRSFNQQPVWRKSTSEHSAVLNVQTSDQDWLNAVCYCYLNFDFTTLDNRERGYTRKVVRSDRINCYMGYSLPDLDKVFIYLGKKEYENGTILPNPDYLNICLAGAKHWGEAFYRDFLNTTHVNNGIILRDHIQSS